MKGICGFIQLDGRPAHPAHLAGMRAALVRVGTGRHHGWHGDTAALGSTEWSLLDRPETEPALLLHPESGCVAAADARLDDRAELAAALGLANDTPNSAELILQAWLRWGERCVEHLEGDFAFAIHDRRQRVLFCARDRMGVKPLYVHHVPGRLFAFASSSSALLAHPQVPHTLNEGRIADFLVTQLEGIDKTSTFYAEVERLPPAHWLEVAADTTRRQRYWTLPTLPAAQLPRSDADWADALSAALERAVARHLAGPGRVGCMLSGGLDSSTLAVIASEQLASSGRGPLATLSSIDSSVDNAETAAIRAMLALPGFAPTLIDRAGIEQIAATLLNCAWDAEEPYDGSMPLIHAQYLAASQQGLDVVLDGIDGDTLFLEGQTLRRQLRTGRWLGAWRNARGIDQIYYNRRSGLRPLAGAARSALVPDRLRRRLRAWRGPAGSGGNLATSLIAPDFAARIDLAGRLAALAAHRSAQPLPQARDEACEALTHPYLTVALERYHRVAAMHGVEPRHPFTDRALVELCAHLPDRQRLRDGWSKAVLRHAMRQRLPQAVCWRRDKQHLGWSLSRTLLDRDWAALRAMLRRERDRIAPYVNLPRLDAAIARMDQPRPDDTAVQDAFEALQLAAWLARRP